MRRERLAAGLALPLIITLLAFVAACGGSSAEGAKDAPPAAAQQSGAGMPSLSGAAAAGGPATPSPAPFAVSVEPSPRSPLSPWITPYAPPACVRAGGAPSP
jgi:hypothetical protein